MIENKANINTVETNSYSDDEDEYFEYSFPLDVIFISLNLCKNKKKMH